EEHLQSHPSDLAADRVEGGQYDVSRRVVDKDVDAGETLEGAHVASLLADHLAFDVFAWQFDRSGHDVARHGIADPVDSRQQEVAGPVFELFFASRFKFAKAADQVGFSVFL